MVKEASVWGVLELCLEGEQSLERPSGQAGGGHVACMQNHGGVVHI